MIRELTMYQCVCDNCGREHQSDGIAGWTDKESAETMATESQWYFEGNKHYCPGCVVDVDDEGGLVIKKESND